MGGAALTRGRGPGRPRARISRPSGTLVGPCQSGRLLGDSAGKTMSCVWQGIGHQSEPASAACQGAHRCGGTGQTPAGRAPGRAEGAGLSPRPLGSVVSAGRRPRNGADGGPEPHLMILVTLPEPTVRPPSRMAKPRPSSMAMGWMSWTVISVLSPGMTISVPSGSVMTPVTSVVRK